MTCLVITLITTYDQFSKGFVIETSENHIGIELIDPLAICSVIPVITPCDQFWKHFVMGTSENNLSEQVQRSHCDVFSHNSYDYLQPFFEVFRD